MASGFVVVCSNSNRQVAVFGTVTGRMFSTQKSADNAARRYEKRHPSVIALACFVECEETEQADD